MNGTTYLPPQETDWKALFEESVDQAVALSCLQGLDLSNTPVEIKRTWQNYAMRSLSSNVGIHEQHSYVHQLMADNNIAYAILKGSSSAYYYDDPLMRSMGDVDLWVADEDLQKAVDVLLENSFVQRDMKHLSHLVFNKEKIHVELHFKPAGLPDGKMGERIKEYLSTIFMEGDIVDIAGNRFYKPNDFHHGLIILMHTYHHMLSEGIGLRHLCDWAVFVKYFERGDFATLFEEKLKAVGLWKFAQILSWCSYRYLGIPYKEWMGEMGEALCKSVIEDIFAGGNFGEKDEERTVQGMSISNRGKDGVKKRKLGQLIVSVNEMGKTQFPKIGKMPLLKHFCFIPLGFRYSFRVLTGKRKRINVVGNMKQAEQRKKIYEQFKLFEVE